jgi:putative hemolysin
MTLDARCLRARARGGDVFLGGRVEQRAGLNLCDRPWHQAAVVTARRNRVPVVPVHIGARKSWLYYLFSLLSARSSGA